VDVPEPEETPRRRGPSAVGATMARLVVACVTAIFVGIDGEVDTGAVLLFGFGAVWLLTTGTLAMRRGWNPVQARAVALVDVLIVIAAALDTGGEDSLAVAALWLAPFAWTAVADAATARVMILIGAVGYLGLWMPEALGRGDGDPLTDLATFSAMYLGSTAIGLVALHLRGQTADRVTMLARARAALVREVGQVEHDERERLSMRLHDGPLQMVISARQDLEEFRDGDAEALELGIETLDQGIQALRAVMVDLYPDHETGADVRERFERIARRYEARGTFAVELELDDGLGGASDDMLVGMAGELVANVAKHAGASLVKISARIVNDRAVLEVADDGVGMTPAARIAAERDGHIGLRSLDRRVRAIGGQWRIRSAPGRGTIVRVELPR
jgi:two-component system NarL family sensor kinase